MKGQEGKKGWGGGKKPVFQWNIQQNVFMCIYLSWRSDVVETGTVASGALAFSWPSSSESSRLGGEGYCRIREFSAEQQQQPMWAHCWADTAESRKQRALTSKFHTPSNLCLGREASAGNPPYVFLYYKELQRMSSFLFKRPRVAVKLHWLDDEKCYQEHKRTPTDGDRRAVTLLN